MIVALYDMLKKRWFDIKSIWLSKSSVVGPTDIPKLKFQQIQADVSKESISVADQKSWVIANNRLSESNEMMTSSHEMFSPEFEMLKSRIDQIESRINLVNEKSKQITSTNKE